MYIRAQVINGKVWFVAKDIALALGLKWDSNLLLTIPENWKGAITIRTLSSSGKGGGVQRLLAVDERGMNKWCSEAESQRRIKLLIGWLEM